MSNYLSQSWLVDRRHALRALGTFIALPMLECMVPLRAAGNAPTTPRRSAFIYLANGVHSLNYQITTEGKDYQFSQSLMPLEKHRQVITPADIERMVGLSEGNIFQGELGLQQMFFLRPVPAWAQYKTPLRALYLCGAGTHPGGGVMGACGRNAASMVLRGSVGR